MCSVICNNYVNYAILCNIAGWRSWRERRSAANEACAQVKGEQGESTLLLQSMSEDAISLVGTPGVYFLYVLSIFMIQCLV